jgi:hypothetical protein
LPAKHTIAISIQNPSMCNKEMRTDECFKSTFNDVGEIVIFDQSANERFVLRCRLQWTKRRYAAILQH